MNRPTKVKARARMVELVLVGHTCGDCRFSEEVDADNGCTVTICWRTTPKPIPRVDLCRRWEPDEHAAR